MQAGVRCYYTYRPRSLLPPPQLSLTQAAALFAPTPQILHTHHPHTHGDGVTLAEFLYASQHPPRHTQDPLDSPGPTSLKQGIWLHSEMQLCDRRSGPGKFPKKRRGREEKGRKKKALFHHTITLTQRLSITSILPTLSSPCLVQPFPPSLFSLFIDALCGLSYAKSRGLSRYG